MGNAVLDSDPARVTVALLLGRQHQTLRPTAVANRSTGGVAQAQNIVLLPIVSFNMVLGVMQIKFLLVYQLQELLGQLLEVYRTVEREFMTVLCLEVSYSRPLYTGAES